MPPLQSVPEVTLAATRLEFDREFALAQLGERSYVAAQTPAQTFHMFGSPEMGRDKQVFEALLNRIQADPSIGRDFGDVEMYRMVRDTTTKPDFHSPHFQPEVNVAPKEQTTSWLGRIAHRRKVPPVTSHK